MDDYLMFQDRPLTEANVDLNIASQLREALR